MCFLWRSGTVLGTGVGNNSKREKSHTDGISRMTKASYMLASMT